MAAGEWVSISAQNELVMRELDVERRELVHNTATETAELAAMYEGHGMSREIAARGSQRRDAPTRGCVGQSMPATAGSRLQRPGSPWARRRSVVGLLPARRVAAGDPVVHRKWRQRQAASILIGVAAAAVVGLLIGKFAERRISWSVVRQALILLDRLRCDLPGRQSPRRQRQLNSADGLRSVSPTAWRTRRCRCRSSPGPDVRVGASSRMTQRSATRRQPRTRPNAESAHDTDLTSSWVPSRLIRTVRRQHRDRAGSEMVLCGPFRRQR